MASSRQIEDLAVERVYTQQAILRMIRRIEDPLTLLLIYVKAYTNIPLSEVAEQAGIGKSAVSMRLARCRKLLEEE